MRACLSEVMEKVLGAKKGGVTLFLIVNDANKTVSLIIDKCLLDDVEHVGFHPMVKTSTTAISRADMNKVIELAGHEPRIEDFGESDVPEESKAEKKPDTQIQSKPVATPNQKQKAGKKQGKAGFDAQAHVAEVKYKKEINFSKWYLQIFTKLPN